MMNFVAKLDRQSSHQAHYLITYIVIAYIINTCCISLMDFSTFYFLNFIISFKDIEEPGSILVAEAKHFHFQQGKG